MYLKYGTEILIHLSLTRDLDESISA